jgi:hypothetical protein
MRKITIITTAILTFGVVFGASAPALAWVNSPRCTNDQLIPTDLADGRSNWARSMKQLTGNSYYLSNAANLEIIDPANEKFHLYPIYSTLAGTFYIGPGPNGYYAGQGPAGYPASANGRASTKAGIESVTQGYKNANVYNEWVCQPGCYTYDQEVRFANGFLPIQKAVDKGVIDVVTLAPEATLDKLSFMTNEVASFTFDMKDAEQDILVFQTASGNHIKVTTEHPLIAEDGSVRRAADFSKGESLVREDGSPDEITSIDTIHWYGRTYNLRPVTTDLVSNVVVAQGYLNGSGRYQLEYVRELNRVILRENIPVDVIPLEDSDVVTDAN